MPPSSTPFASMPRCLDAFFNAFFNAFINAFFNAFFRP
jgi:hypothetical protein